MSIFEKIERWLHPYRYAFEEEEVKEFTTKKKRAKQNFKGKIKPKMSEQDEKAKKEFLSRGEIGIEIVTVSKQLNKTDALKTLDRSDYSIGYFHHDSDSHQLAVKFNTNSGWLYHERNEGKRKKLQPLVYMKNKKLEDKTHMIPIGFHGSENDERLLVGFHGKINKGSLKTLEEYVTNVNSKEPILWFVDIRRQADQTAIWNATVWDEEHNLIADESFHDKSQFVWL